MHNASVCKSHPNVLWNGQAPAPQRYMCTQLLLQAVVVSGASTKVLLASFFPLSALAPVQDVSGGAQTHLGACPYML